MFVVSLIPDAFDNVCNQTNVRPDCVKHLFRLIAWGRAGAKPKGGCWPAAPLSKLQKLKKKNFLELSGIGTFLMI